MHSGDFPAVSQMHKCPFFFERYCYSADIPVAFGAINAIAAANRRARLSFGEFHIAVQKKPFSEMSQ